MNEKPCYAYVDTETTGLHPELHEIWEVGLIYPHDTRDGWEWREASWQLPVDLGRAELKALEIGQFYYRRTAKLFLSEVAEFATEFEKCTRDLHLIGAVVSFDTERLARLLRHNGACPSWHYHSIDIEAMVVGYLQAHHVKVELPWDSAQLSRELGVLPDNFEKHTALGDARWVKAQHEAILGAVRP